MELLKSTSFSILSMLLVGTFGLLGSSSLQAAMPDGAFQVASGKVFIFNPRTHSWSAINEKGRVIKSGRASGGRHYCPDIRRSCRTPAGVYRISSMRGADCKSSRYPVGRGGAKMPYCSFFSKYYAVHGSYDVPRYNASHGCIRVVPSDALWLQRHFMKIGTKVIVKPY